MNKMSETLSYKKSLNDCAVYNENGIVLTCRL